MNMSLKTIIVNLILFVATYEASEPKSFPQSPCLKPAVPTSALNPFFLTDEDELVDLFGDNFSLTDSSLDDRPEKKVSVCLGAAKKSTETPVTDKTRQRHKKSKAEEKNKNQVRAVKSTLFFAMKSSRLEKRKS